MATLSIVLRKDKLNRRGEAPIYFRIINNREIRYVSAKLNIPIDNWDEKNKRIKPKHPNSARFNAYLAKKFTELQDEVLELDTYQKPVTTRQLKEKIYGKKPTDFFSFAEQIMYEYKMAGQIGTNNKNRSILNKLRQYHNGSILFFQEVTPDFLVNYAHHLQLVRGNSQNTINKDFKFIRKVFNDAYRKDIIEHKVNPFFIYKMKTSKTDINFLTEEELVQIENVNTTSGTKLELHKDMFVFASYTAGIRISDLLQLQWKNFSGTHIEFKIKKTSNQHSIKIPDIALALIEKHKPEKVKKSDFLFPALPNNLDLNDPIAVHNAISSATAYINKNLKILSGKASIDKKISFHVSRHTWATMALRKGMGLEKVSKLLGHAEIRETMIYAKIVNSDLDKAMDLFNV